MNQPFHNANKRRAGASLMELMATLAISATLLTSSMVVMRSSYGAWQFHRADAKQADAADTVLRHYVRTVRQAESVLYHATIGAYVYFAVTTPDGNPHWYIKINNFLYYYSKATPTGAYIGEILTEDLVDMRVTAYEADGVTPTSVLADIHLVDFAIDISQPSGGTLTSSSYAWIRAW